MRNIHLRVTWPLLVLLACTIPSSSFAQLADEDALIGKIYPVVERLLGANKFEVVDSEVTTDSDQSTVIEGSGVFSGLADTYFKASYNSADKLTFFYVSASEGGATSPETITKDFISDPSFSSLYLPMALKKRIVFDSYTAKLNPANADIDEVNIGFRLTEQWPLFPPLDIQLDKVVVDFTVEKPMSSTGRKVSANLSAVNSWDTDTYITLSSNLTTDPNEWTITGEIKNLSLGDVVERLGIDDLVGLPIPGPIMDQEITVASIALKPIGQWLEVYGLTSLGNLQVVVENESYKEQKSEDELLEEYYDWVNSDEVTDAVQETEKTVSKWSFMAAYSLPEDFRFASLVPELSVLDQFQLFNAGLVISTAEKELDTRLPIFANLGAGNTKVYKGLTFIALQNLERYNIDKSVGNLSDVTGVQNVLFRGNIPMNIQDLSLEAALTFTDAVNIANVLHFRNLKLQAKPASSSPEFTIFADVGLTVDRANTLEFTGGLGLEPIALTAKLVARQKNAWTNPFGFQGISVGPFELQAGVNFSVAAPYPIPDNMIVGGAMILGEFEGQAIIGFDVNSLQKNMLSVSFNRIGLLDIVDGFVGPQIANKIPPYVRDELDASIEDAEFTFVPIGYSVSTALGTFDEGFRIAGKAEIIDWKGDMDITLEPPSSLLSAGLTVAAHMDPIKLDAGDLKVFHLTGAHGEGRPTWEVNLSTAAIINQNATDKIIYINGGLNILNVGKGNALIELTPQGYLAQLDGELYGFLDANLDARISQFTNPIQNTYVKVDGKVGGITKKVQRFLSKQILDHAFELRSVSFEGNLDALQSGAEANVKFKIAGQNKSIRVHISAKDGAKFFENVALEIAKSASPVIEGIIAAEKAAEEAAKRAAEEAKKAALATAQVAEQAAQQATRDAQQAARQAAQVANAAKQEADRVAAVAAQEAQRAAQTAQQVANTIDDEANRAAKAAASEARKAARETEKTARDVGKFFANGATAALGFGGVALNWTKNFATNITGNIASIFEGNQRSRIKSDVPPVWIEHRDTGQLVYCVDCNNGRTDVRIRPRIGGEAEEWQVLPVKGENFNYIVSKSSGLNIHLHGKTEAEGMVMMRKHASEDKFKEKIEFVQATADGIYYRLQYKKRPFYIFVDGAGKLDLTFDRNRASLFRILIPGDEAAAARQAELAAQQAADAARARVKQQKQPILAQAQQAAVAAQQEAQSAHAQTMQAYQSQIAAAEKAARDAAAAAARARQEADARAREANVAPSPAPAATVAPNTASALSHEAPRASLPVPGSGQRAASLSKAQAGHLLKNGVFELHWQGDGNLVVYKNGNQPTWASGTHGRADRLSWQPDGNLVVYSGNRALWATATSDGQQGGHGGQILRLNNRGVLVVRNNSGVIWRSNAAEPSPAPAPAAPAIPTKVAKGQLPVPGGTSQAASLGKSQDGVILENGAYILRWQGDGNLVVYRNGSQPTWASGTHGRADKLSWQPDGNLVIYAGNRALWATATSDGQQGGRGGRILELRTDGTLVILNVDNRVIWQSK